MNVFRLLSACAAWALAGSTLFIPAAAQETWPSKPVRVIVAYPPGSGPDLLARVIGQSLATTTAQPFVVDNRGGANGIIASDAVAKSAPDGHTVLVIDRLALFTNPALVANVPFKWDVDLKPVTDLARVQLYLVSSSKFAPRTFAEFIQHVRANPGKLNFATNGNGHVNHIGMEALTKSFGLQMANIPYKSFPQVVAALMAGEVISTITGPVPVLAMVRDGRLRALAVGADKRTRELPDVPPIAELGGNAGMLPPTVFVMMTQGGTPEAVLARMNARVTADMRKPDVVGAIEKVALEIAPSTPAASMAAMREVAPGFLKAMADAGVKPE